MKVQFEDMFKKIAEAAAEAEDDEEAEPSQPSGSASETKISAAKPPPGANFQDTIRRTMERMKTSGDRTTEELNKEGASGLMEDLIGMLGKANLDGEGGEEEINSVLMGMMDHLTNKDILYDPMKELHDQFPVWLEKNKETVSQEDRARYELQKTVVAEIVGRFESNTYSDSNTVDRQYILDRMQKVSGQQFQRDTAEGIAHASRVDARSRLATAGFARKATFGAGSGQSRLVR
jgi:peroxin-19